MGNGQFSIHPFQPYACKNGYINICIGNDKLFVQFARLFTSRLGRMCAQKNPSRVKHREVLDALLIPIFLANQGVLAIEIARFNVPAELVASIPEALDGARSRGRVVTHEHPATKEQTVQTLPLPFGLDGKARASKRSPLLMSIAKRFFVIGLGSGLYLEKYPA